MADKFTKTTYGFVTQTFDEDGKCTHQEFVAGDQCDYEDMESNVIDEQGEQYQPYHMIQPNTVIDITIHGGLISEIGARDNNLPGVKIEQRDYDVDGFDEDRIEQDEEGKDCAISEYEL